MIKCYCDFCNKELNDSNFVYRTWNERLFESQEHGVISFKVFSGGKVIASDICISCLKEMVKGLPSDSDES